MFFFCSRYCHSLHFTPNLALANCRQRNGSFRGASDHNSHHDIFAPALDNSMLVYVCVCVCVRQCMQWQTIFQICSATHMFQIPNNFRQHGSRIFVIIQCVNVCTQNCQWNLILSSMTFVCVCGSGFGWAVWSRMARRCRRMSSATGDKLLSRLTAACRWYWLWCWCWWWLWWWWRC